MTAPCLGTTRVKSRRRPGVALIAGLALFWFGCVMAGLPDEAAAAKGYKYVDDRGNIVLTNQWDSIPERYRERVKVVEMPDEPKAGIAMPNLGGGAPAGGIAQQATESLKVVASSAQTAASGLTSDRSTVVGASFVAGVIMLATMMLSKNPATRLLMRWLLVLLVFGTTAHVYFSSLDKKTPGTLMQKVTGTTKEVERAQQEKAQQIQKLESGGREP